jgi:predicted nuclease of restriction endonuclease-like RecB superfamily
VLDRVASALGVTAEALEASLFADLPHERRVCSLGAPMPAALADDANAALIEGWVARALSVQVRIWGDARPVVRHARRAGLICVAYRAQDETLVLEISGPAALFRRTAIYGRALASIVSRLRLCDRFELRALCSLPASDETATLVLTNESFAAPASEIRVPDDRVERRFLHEFRRQAPGWQVEAAPAPIEAKGVLLFPDFELFHPELPEQRWMLEIVGFWTPDYLRAKLERLSGLGSRFLLCVDASKSCGESDIPEHPRVIAFRRRINPAELLERLQAER